MVIKTFFFALISTWVSLSSCTSNPTIDNKTEAISDQTTSEKSSEQINIPDSWAIYSGNVGLYGKQIILELAIYGDSVKGNYFYSKHQKPLLLSGTIDARNHVKAKESYKNKVTGYWEFNFSKGDIVGTWSKSPSMKDPEGIIAKLCDIEQEDYSPQFETYENKHLVTFYNRGDHEEENEVVDVCKINWLDDSHFTFHYNVIRRNGHLGSIEGLAKIEDDGKGVFRDEESCELTFIFDRNTIEIVESDCDYYHGANAYFDGVLQKVK